MQNPNRTLEIMRQEALEDYLQAEKNGQTETMKAYEERYRRLGDRIQEAKELALKIADFVNGSQGVDEFEFARQMHCQHRTLQQNAMKLFVSWMQFLAELESSEYDLRNEASVMFARKALEATKDMALPFI